MRRLPLIGMVLAGIAAVFAMRRKKKTEPETEIEVGSEDMGTPAEEPSASEAPPAESEA
jgi:hypothetical protein